MHPPSILLVPDSNMQGNKFGSSSVTSQSKRARTTGGNDGGINEHRPAEALNKSKQSVLVRILEQIYGIEAQGYPRKHWNYVEGKQASSERLHNCIILPVSEADTEAVFMYCLASLPVGARYLDRLLVDDADEVKAEEIASESNKAPPSQLSQRPASSRPQTGRYSLDLHAKASTRAAILVAVADKFYLLSALAGLLK